MLDIDPLQLQNMHAKHKRRQLLTPHYEEISSNLRGLKQNRESIDSLDSSGGSSDDCSLYNENILDKKEKLVSKIANKII